MQKMLLAFIWISIAIIVINPSAGAGRSNAQGTNNYAVRLMLGQTRPSDEYLDFIAGHYHNIIVPDARPDLVAALRDRNQDLTLILYRNFVFTDTSKADYPEDYFAHNTTDANNHNPHHRIIKRALGEMYLMNLTSPGWRDHIINSIQKHIHDYDALMADDCGPGIESRVDFLPDDYADLETWLAQIKDFLSIIRNEFDSTLFVFNGLYVNSQYPNRDLLQVTDGGIREGFVFHLSSGEFLPEEYWKVLLNWVIQDTQTKHFIASAKMKKKNGETVTTDERMFAFTSYLLVRNENVIYSAEDWGLVTGINATIVQYYPEMDVDLGEPLKTATKVEDYFNPSTGLYERQFSSGIVLANPTPHSITWQSDHNYYQALPVGGGVVNDDGSYGTTSAGISYQLTNQATVPAQSGVILLNEATLVKGNDPGNRPADYDLAQNYPNPFNSSTKISYQLATAGRLELVIFNTLGKEVRAFIQDESAGEYSILWDGRDNLGNVVNSGVYLYRLEINGQAQIRRMVLLR